MAEELLIQIKVIKVSNRVEIGKIRKEYSQQSLAFECCPDNPVGLFEQWLNDAIVRCVDEPTSMTLSTVTSDCRPSARIVLLKSVEDNSFVFFSNYESRKAKQIESTPYAALTFFWKELERQVNIEGGLKKVSSEVSDNYFSQRPYNSKIGAWASRQSRVVESREILEKQFEDYKCLYPDEVPRPRCWGGYILKPGRIEFWQGRPGRLHDRVLYTRKNSKWEKVLLSP